MTSVFADTSFYVGLLNPRDSLHEIAVALSQTTPGQIVTTDFVLVEVGNFFCRPDSRELFRQLVKGLSASRRVEIIPATRELWTHGFTLFVARPDKEWSLTDCISFHVMTERCMTDALTADAHFAQAGYRPLLLPDPL
jgi:predicted nucleic acid-binding protein